MLFTHQLWAPLPGISEATERNDEGDSAFLTTCRTSSVECAELLIAHGASIHDKDNNDTNGLMFAASGKNPEVRTICVLDFGVTFS